MSIEHSNLSSNMRIFHGHSRIRPCIQFLRLQSLSRIHLMNVLGFISMGGELSGGELSWGFIMRTGRFGSRVRVAVLSSLQE
jgi:hypothetical protein